MLLPRVKHVLLKNNLSKALQIIIIIHLLEQVLYNCENNVAKHFV